MSAGVQLASTLGVHNKHPDPLLFVETMAVSNCLVTEKHKYFCEGTKVTFYRIVAFPKSDLETFQSEKQTWYMSLET